MSFLELVPLLLGEQSVSRLLAQPILVNIPPPQPLHKSQARHVGLRTRPKLQRMHLHPGHRIQPDLVHALTRPLFGVEKVAKQGVDVVGRGQPLGQHRQRLALARAPDAVEYEALRLPRHHDGHEADAPHLRRQEGKDLVVRACARHELHHAVARRDVVVRVEEPLRVVEVRCHLGRHEVAGVGRQDAVVGQQVLELREDGHLELERLGQAVDGHPRAFGARVELNVGRFRLGRRALVATCCRGDAHVGRSKYMAGVGVPPGAVVTKSVGDVLDRRVEGVLRRIIQGDRSKVGRPDDGESAAQVAGAYNQDGAFVEIMFGGVLPVRWRDVRVFEGAVEERRWPCRDMADLCWVFVCKTRDAMVCPS